MAARANTKVWRIIVNWSMRCSFIYGRRGDEKRHLGDMLKFLGQDIYLKGVLGVFLVVVFLSSQNSERKPP